jgi:AcrR family transcriptional regulator
MVETRRQQIEDAASALFRERGYSATSVRDIARAIDLQGGSLYAHVASKEDVLWAIVERAAERFHTAVRPIASDSTAPAAQRLRRMVRAHAGVVTADLGNATVFLHEWRFLGDARRAEVARRRDEYEALFRQVIAEGVATGEFVAEDPKLAATLILSALNGIAGWYSPDGPLPAAEIADRYADLFMRALAPTGGID